MDIAITEIGGTSGDIESLPFLEAARQFKLESAANDVIFLHLTLVPFIRAAKELKTKPSQHSVATLRGIGIEPDLLVCRSEVPLEEDHFKKLSMFCNVPTRYVVEELDVKNSIYEVPLELARQELDLKVLELLNMEPGTLDLDSYRQWLDGVLHPQKECTVAVVGKYIKHQDAYKSIYEALHHAGIKHSARVKFLLVEAEDLESSDAEKILGPADAILAPGGFGERGVRGKVKAVEYARTHKVPFLGICLGMQCAVIEFARDVLGWKDANSTEFNEMTTHPVIDLMLEQRSITDKGGTMRLGAYPCVFDPESLAAKIYGKTEISERHRHRYEFNSKYRKDLEDAGLSIAGTNPESGLVEVVELKDHPYFIGCQYHPEFKSRPQDPHPLFAGLIAAALKGHEHAKAQ